MRMRIDSGQKPSPAALFVTTRARLGPPARVPSSSFFANRFSRKFRIQVVFGGRTLKDMCHLPFPWKQVS